MPRTLPWTAKASANKQDAAKPSSSTSPAHRQRVAAEEQSDLVDADLNPIHPVRSSNRKVRESHDRLRSPSTSPPPAPPNVEYMREGYNADDVYLMVEDEFLSTAKLFTQHIHHAEYVRMKKLARSRGAQTLQSLERGVDGVTEQNTGLQLRLEATAGSKKRKDALSKLQDGEEDSESEGEDEYMQDPQLAGLMTGDTHNSRDLSGIIKARSHTRAAAGFSQSPKTSKRVILHDKGKGVAKVEREAKSSRDSTKVMKPTSKALGLFEEEPSTDEESDEVATTTSPSRPSLTNVRISRDPARSVKLETTTEPSDDGWLAKSRHSDTTSDFLKRRAARAERAVKTTSSSRPDDIPTFIF